MKKIILLSLALFVASPARSAEITLTIPDAVVQRVLDAFAGRFGYDPASGLTKAQFARQQFARIIKQIVVNYEAEQAAIQARDQQEADSESQIQVD